MQAHFFTSNPQKTEPVVTVSALNQAVAQCLEQNFALAWISGEISNFTRASSGHWYFTLKDQQAQVRAVMFRGRSQYASFTPREGDKVEVRATVGLYAPRGDYQINVEAIRRAGLGSLYEQFLQLKSQLAAEGLFDVERKKAIPVWAKKIAVVTSPNAAALRDVLTALQRRASHCEVVIYPTPVQGDNAGSKIAQAIAQAEADAYCELIIVCRGGGSIEDLWAFNEEVVARTIAHCSLPVISGVGHETDFTICDFVADLRAPTPTAAAELAARPRADWLANLQQARTQMQRQMRRLCDKEAQRLDWLCQRLPSPKASLQIKRQHLQHQAQSLRFALQTPLQAARHQLLRQQSRLASRKPDCQQSIQQLAHLEQRAKRSMHQQLQQDHLALKELASKLELLNPQRTLERGYSIVRTADGSLYRSGKQLQAEQQLSLQTAQDLTHIRIKEIL
ncbi:MAG: exodeoxyribonuclease VII large subunit [Burkholderiales bacterium]|nr:exodeoxyribonuclease VII large subunit [Burkholderiales bacterium]